MTDLKYSPMVFRFMCAVAIHTIFPPGGEIFKGLMIMLIGIMSAGYNGKLVNVARVTGVDHTFLSRFLTKEWATEQLACLLRVAVEDFIFLIAWSNCAPVYCIIDDTCTPHTKPSSRSKHPIEGAYFHFSHLLRKSTYGHQMVAVLLSCGGITLPYSIEIYERTTDENRYDGRVRKTKIEMVSDIAALLSRAPFGGYLLCDSWYTCDAVMNAFLACGYVAIAALKLNRKLFLPNGLAIKIKELAKTLDPSTWDIYTVQNRAYRVCRILCSIKGASNVVVLLSYPVKALGRESALRAFVSLDPSLPTEVILEHYQVRWNIEVFFRSAKKLLGLGKIQVRDLQAIQRECLLICFVWFFCSTQMDPATLQYRSFENGYRRANNELAKERIEYVYYWAQKGRSMDKILDDFGLTGNMAGEWSSNAAGTGTAETDSAAPKQAVAGYIPA